MEKLFPVGTEPHVVKDNLLAQCYSTENMVYQKPLSEEELAKLEKEFIQASVKFAKLNDDFQKLKDEFKNKMKPIEQLQKEQLKVLKNKAVETEGTVYLIDDQEDKVMRVYDGEGNMLFQRPLMQSERQLSINRAAVNE